MATQVGCGAGTCGCRAPLTGGERSKATGEHPDGTEPSGRLAGWETETENRSPLRAAPDTRRDVRGNLQRRTKPGRGRRQPAVRGTLKESGRRSGAPGRRERGQLRCNDGGPAALGERLSIQAGSPKERRLNNISSPKAQRAVERRGEEMTVGKLALSGRTPQREVLPARRQ